MDEHGTNYRRIIMFDGSPPNRDVLFVVIGAVLFIALAVQMLIDWRKR
jgi:hypothetical protein